MAQIEEPAFESIKKDGAFELRQYRNFIVAETFVKGDMDQAGSEGFRRIANYIFGNNVSVAQPGAAADGAKRNEKIAMTAPVTLELLAPPEAKPASEKIAMTAPVALEKTNADTYRVHFVMPSKYSMQTLPQVVNPLVALREVAGQKMAVVRFSGFSTDEKVSAQTAQLQAWLLKEGLKVVGRPQFARYDPPIVPPFLRRSEVMIPVE